MELSAEFGYTTIETGTTTVTLAVRPDSVTVDSMTVGAGVGSPG
jgi:hypothetical protein